MLTKKDLNWTAKFFSIYSKLMWIPVTFQPFMLGGGLMETGEVCIRRRIGFKMTQILFASQTLFISSRALEYLSAEDVELNWDFVPFMLIAIVAYLTYNVMAYLLFDLGRDLNKKVFNEISKLRGKSNKKRNEMEFT